MVKEKLTSSPEQERGGERFNEIAAEQQERIRENVERNAETKNKENLEEARKEALEKAHSKEKEHKKTERKAESAERRRGPITKKERDASFNRTMNEARHHMSGPSRTFSKVIHNKAVERVSEIGGSTIARPNAILSGAVVAFVLTLLVIVIARHYGYPLSGFETIGAFAVGWLLGIVFDFLKLMVTGKSS